MRRLFDRCGGPKAYRAKLEFDQAFRQWEATCRDPKATDAQAKTQWELVEVAETKLKWWQSKTVGDPPYASKWE